MPDTLTQRGLDELDLEFCMTGLILPLRFGHGQHHYAITVWRFREPTIHRLRQDDLTCVRANGPFGDQDILFLLTRPTVTAVNRDFIARDDDRTILRLSARHRCG